MGEDDKEDEDEDKDEDNKEDEDNDEEEDLRMRMRMMRIMSGEKHSVAATHQSKTARSTIMMGNVVKLSSALFKKRKIKLFAQLRQN